MSQNDRKRPDDEEVRRHSERSTGEEGEEGDPDDQNPDYMCGLGSWRPEWLQWMASPKVFVVYFSLIGILLGASFTNFIGTVSTLEKRFAFESKVSGFILIADNISQMFVSPVIGYLGSHMNRPALCATGNMLVAVASFMSATPYFLYGPGTHLLDSPSLAALSSGNASLALGVGGTGKNRFEFCARDEDPAAKYAAECGGEAAGRSATVMGAVIILWVASFVNGIGYTAFYTVGYPYIDDNVQKKNSPLYISTANTLRLLGPTAGFLLSSLCLRYYENPLVDPGISRTDPRWVGAWWIGFLVIGTLIALCSIPMFLFPKQFKPRRGTPAWDLMMEARQAEAAAIAAANETDGGGGGGGGGLASSSVTRKAGGKLREIRHALRRLVSNPVLLFHAFGNAIRALGYLGYYIFKPKYIEQQYRQSASRASFWTGSTSVFAMAIGIMCGGVAITYFKPSARKLVVYIFAVEMITNMSVLGAMFLGCPAPTFPNTQVNPTTGLLDLANGCNQGCGCTNRIFHPVCSSDGVSNYFSPCYGGCTTVNMTEHPFSFGSCDCTVTGGMEVGGGSGARDTMTSGYCPSDCNNFVFYIILLMTSSVISSTARTGNSLITLRCVDAKDKSFAMGVLGSIMAVLTFMPYPIIFGAITDSTCVVWETKCGSTGNCWLYDVDKFRKYLHGAALAFMTVGSLFDIGIIAYSSRIGDLYEDVPEDDDDDGSGTTNGALAAPAAAAAAEKVPLKNLNITTSTMASREPQDLYHQNEATATGAGQAQSTRQRTSVTQRPSLDPIRRLSEQIAIQPIQHS